MLQSQVEVEQQQQSLNALAVGMGYVGVPPLKNNPALIHILKVVEAEE